MIVPAFVLGLGANGLGIVRALGRHGVPVVGIYRGEDEVGRHSRFCRAERLPDMASERTSYLARLEDLAGKSGERPVLIPTNDATVALLVEERDRLEARFRFVLPSTDGVLALMDKAEVVAIARRAGVPGPVTVTASTMSEAIRAADEIPVPCIVKPRRPWTEAAARLPKVARLDSKEEIREFIRTHEAALPALVFQELIPGEDSDYAFCCVYRNAAGVTLAMLSGRAIHRYPPGLGWIASCIAARVPELEEATERVLAEVKYTGLAEIEFKRDRRDGRYKLFEVNTRSWAHNALGPSCGVDFLHLAYRDALGASPAPMPRQRVRAFVNLELEAGVLWRMTRAGRFPGIPWRALDWRTAHPYFAWDDPLPVIHKFARRFSS